MGLLDRPSHYLPMQFHAVRLIAFISSLIVASIMIYFCFQLKADGYKLPWTFLFVMAASCFSVIALIVTTIVYLRATLWPLLHMILNILLGVLWIAGFALMTNNIYGTLGHSCSRVNWSRDEGIMICHTYKALYAFSVFALLAQVAQIVLDVRARRAQTAAGRYNVMRDSLNGKPEDMQALTSRDSANELSSTMSQVRDDHVGWRPGQKSEVSSLSLHDYASPHESNSQSYYGGESQEPMRVSQFHHPSGQDTHYDPGDMGTFRQQQYRDH